MTTTSRLDDFLARALFVARGGRVTALDRATGATLWVWRAAGGNDMPLLMLDGERLVVSTPAGIHALDPATGEELWANRLEDRERDGWTEFLHLAFGWTALLWLWAGRETELFAARRDADGRWQLVAATRDRLAPSPGATA